jgi:hypothetical protein
MPHENKNGKRQLNIALTEEEYAELERRAKETGKTYKELVCGDMELGRSMTLSHAGNVLGLEKTDVSAFVLDALRKHNGFWGVHLERSVEEIGKLSTWENLTDADRLMIVGQVEVTEQDAEEKVEALNMIAKTLGTEEKTVRAFHKRIVKTEENDYDLRVD